MTASEAKKSGYSFEHARKWNGSVLVWSTWLYGPLATREQYIELPITSSEKNREREAIEAFNRKMGAYARLLGS